MAAVTYCRICADKTGAGLGVERQAADCRELALGLGLGEPEVLSDNDLSAYSGKRRPGYERLKQGLLDGRWTTLLVWHVDRLCRSVRDLEDIVDLVNGKVAVHTVKGGEIDLETPGGPTAGPDVGHAGQVRVRAQIRPRPPCPRPGRRKRQVARGPPEVRLAP